MLSLCEVKRKNYVDVLCSVSNKVLLSQAQVFLPRFIELDEWTAFTAKTFQSSSSEMLTMLCFRQKLKHNDKV